MGFYIANGGILVPSYGFPDDDLKAIRSLMRMFPKRRIIQIITDDVININDYVLGFHCDKQVRIPGSTISRVVAARTNMNKHTVRNFEQKKQLAQKQHMPPHLRNVAKEETTTEADKGENNSAKEQSENNQDNDETEAQTQNEHGQETVEEEAYINELEPPVSGCEEHEEVQENFALTAPPPEGEKKKKLSSARVLGSFVKKSFQKKKKLSTQSIQEE